MRVVLDSNILARSAYRFAGPAGEVLSQLGEPGHTLITSVFLLDELSRVLGYPRLQRYHGLTIAEVERFVADVAGASLLVELGEAPMRSVVPSDPDDDPIVATAIAGKAEVLCTRDKHLHHPEVAAYCRAHGIRVLTDVELLRLLRTKDATG